MHIHIHTYIFISEYAQIFTHLSSAAGQVQWRRIYVPHQRPSCFHLLKLHAPRVDLWA